MQLEVFTGCGRFRIDGCAVRGYRGCFPKGRDNVATPYPSWSPLPTEPPVVPGKPPSARDQPWWIGRPILVSVFVFLLLGLPDQTRRARWVAHQTVPTRPIQTKPFGVRRALHRTLPDGPRHSSRENQKQADEQLGDDLRRVVSVDSVTRVDELLDPGGVAAACTPVSWPEPRRVTGPRGLAQRRMSLQADSLGDNERELVDAAGPARSGFGSGAAASSSRSKPTSTTGSATSPGTIRSSVQPRQLGS